MTAARQLPLLRVSIATLELADPAEINDLLVTWGHRMGALTRPVEMGFWGHVLRHEGQPVALATASTLIRTQAGGGVGHVLTRQNTVELSRLCAVRPGLCRAMLRLWREFVFPALGYPYALSYQDADIHQGHTYRFDGWRRAPELSRSGTDARSGTRGRRKWIWIWNADPAALAAATKGGGE